MAMRRESSSFVYCDELVMHGKMEDNAKNEYQG